MKTNRNSLGRLLTLLSLLTLTMAETRVNTRMNTNFVFHRLTDQAVAYNSETKTLYQDMIPCDLYQAMNTLDNISMTHEQLCNKPLPEFSVLNDTSKIKDYSKHYIMLPDAMSYEEGTRACQALDTNLAEVRSEEQRKDFVNFMLSSQKSVTFAGLTISDKESSIIFGSDGQSLDTSHLDNVLYSEESKPILWQEFLDKKWAPYIDHEQSHNHRSNEYLFTYTVLTEDLQIRTLTPLKILITAIKDSDIERNYPLTVICNRPKNLSNVSHKLDKFRLDCKNNQIRLKMMAVNAKLELKKVLPNHTNNLNRYKITKKFDELFLTKLDHPKRTPMAEHCMKLQKQGYDIFKSPTLRIMDMEHNDDMSKRSIAISSMLQPVYSVMNFALEDLAKPIIKYAVSAMIRNWSVSRHQGRSRGAVEQKNNTVATIGTPADQIINKINYDQNITHLIIEDQKLSLDALHIVIFIQAATENLARLLMSDGKLPLSQFWTIKTYENVKSQLQQENAVLANTMADATFTISKGRHAYRLEYYLPFLEQKKRAHILEVHSLPIIHGYNIYQSTPASRYMAVNFEKDFFMPMTYREVKACTMTSCSIASPMIDKYDRSYCGLDAYFASTETVYANKACDYSISTYNQPNQFLTIADTTYYSVGEETLVEMKCFGKEVMNFYYNITGLGSFVMPKRCQVSINRGLIVNQIQGQINGKDLASNKLLITTVESPSEALLQSFIEEDDNDKKHFKSMKIEIRLITIILMLWISGTFVACTMNIHTRLQRRREKIRQKRDAATIKTIENIFNNIPANQLDDAVVPDRDLSSTNQIERVGTHMRTMSSHSITRESYRYQN